MPHAAKPLFRLNVLNAKILRTDFPRQQAAQYEVRKWAKTLATKGIEAKKETELLPEFLTDIFTNCLGYTGPAGGSDSYTLKREALVEVDGNRADAALGSFTIGEGQNPIAVAVEGKGPTDPLDVAYKGRKRSAVEQAYQYAGQLEIDWYIVTNLHEIRLYHKGRNQQTYERFEVARLAAEENRLRRFLFLLDASRVVRKDGGNHLNDLLVESKELGQQLTDKFYKDYRQLRERTFEHLRTANPVEPPPRLLSATQKMLDRVLFVAFCEKRGLLPVDTIRRAYLHESAFIRKPIWDNFVDLFKAVDMGGKGRLEEQDIPPYNGGLFADDPYLNGLNVTDAICAGFEKLSTYEYGENPEKPEAPIIDVEILGHIFEQSITDLEEMARFAAGPMPDSNLAKAGPSKRKKEGAFYTPAFVTRYIVQETLGPVLADAFETLRRQQQEAAPKLGKKFLDDPKAYDPAALNKTGRETLVGFWQRWEARLMEVRIVDPSCGSGAFLIEAFEQMLTEYKAGALHLEKLGEKTLFDFDREILTNNLFGMDLNSEAVEIARLSLWIKTAQKGKALTSLDGNVVEGNSVVGGTVSPLAAWQAKFPAVFAAGGFDVVIGNPPYVRQEWIKADKPYLQEHYQAYDGVADLYVYFYELGLKVLKPGGRLGFITSSSLIRAGYAEALRSYLASRCSISQIIDLGDTQIFKDALDVYPAMLILHKQASSRKPPVQTMRFRRDDSLVDIEQSIRKSSIHVPAKSLDPKGWRLESGALAKIRSRMQIRSAPLNEIAKKQIYLGLKSGLTKAFVVDADTARRFLREAASKEVLNPFIGGQHVRRWMAEPSGEWLITMPSGYTAAQCGSGDVRAASAWVQKRYPAIWKHLQGFEIKARSRTDQGEFWWELRACDYYEAFKNPKIMYPDIAKYPRFHLDTTGLYSNNTTYFFPSADYYLLGVLNSDAIWFALSGISIPFGERAGEMRYRLFTQYMEQLPIPEPTAKQKRTIEANVKHVIALTKEQHESRRAVLDWLAAEYGIAKPTQKLQNLAGIDEASFLAEVKKIRGKTAPLSVRDVKRLKEEFFSSVTPIQTLAAEALHLERAVSDTVNEAYGLTPEDVALMWETAPARMPATGP